MLLANVVELNHNGYKERILNPLDGQVTGNGGEDLSKRMHTA